MDQNNQSIKKEKSTKVFNNKWILRKKVSSGSFGVVFIGQDKQTQELVAIKLEKEDNEEVMSLDREVQILEQLSNLKQVPYLYWHGSENNYNILVTTLLGRDLAHYMKIHKKFTLKTVLMLFDQLLTIIEDIHNRHVIHRDLKPENILVGREQESHLVYMIDFGISKIYKDSQGRHMQFKEKKPFIGTTRYASIAAHQGLELGRKDDLESLGYVMIFLLKGQLPWQNLQHIPNKDKTEIVGEMKMRTKTSELCRDLPSEFIKYLEYVKKLSFKSQPDYSYLRNIFIKLGNQNNVQYCTNDFDWSIQDQNTSNTNTNQSNQHFNSNNEQKKNNIKNGLLQPPGMYDGGFNSSRNIGDSRRASNTSFNSMSQNSVYIKYQPQNSMYKPNSSLHFDDQFRSLQNNSRNSISRNSLVSQNLRKRNESTRKNSNNIIAYSSQQQLMSPQRKISNSRRHKNSVPEYRGSLNNISFNNLENGKVQHGQNYLKQNKYLLDNTQNKFNENHVIMEQSKSNEDGNQQSTQYCNLEMEEMKENSLDAKIKLLQNFGVKAQFIKIKKGNIKTKSQFG